MGKVIMVSDEVYEKLKRMKKPGESFSDVIKRLLKDKPKLTDIAGSKTITKRDWQKIEEIFKDRDKLDELRRNYLLRLVER